MRYESRGMRHEYGVHLAQPFLASFLPGTTNQKSGAVDVGP